MALTHKRQRFVVEYCRDYHAGNAALRAGYSKDSCDQEGSRLLKFEEIQKAIEEREEEIAAAAALTPEWVLRQWMIIARADPGELMQNRRINCRFCWGTNHKYQWTQTEFDSSLTLAMAPPTTTARGQLVYHPIPDPSGGFGFDGNKEPAADCPSCHGNGVTEIYVADTRKLSPDGRKLYAGLQVTKDGIKVLFRDQEGALNNLAKYLRMIPDSKELSGPGGKPIDFRNATVKELTDGQLEAIAAGSGS